MTDKASVEHDEDAKSLPSGHAPEENYLAGSSGWTSWLLTYDHKRVGLLYLATISLFFLVGGVLAMLMRLELLSAGSTIDVWLHQLGFLAEGQSLVTPNVYNQLFTLHGGIMIFLFLIPAVPAVLGNFVLPLEIGARDVAFPRLNLASWYVFLFGACFMVYSILAEGVDTGWTFYTPYATTSEGSVIPMTLGIFIIGFSSIFTGINFITTVHKMRAPGMTWNRLPLMVWALYATAIIQVMATPVLGITLLLLVLESAFKIGIFNPELGGDPLLYQHFFWFYSHPAVYIMILPGMGIVSEVITAFSRKRIYGYKFIALSSVAIALLGFLVWGHHMFVSGQAAVASMIFSILTFLVGIPSGVKTFNWVATLYKGSISLKTPMLYVLSFLVLFSIGGLTGIMLGTLAWDIHVHDTYFVVAHFHYVMVGGMVTAFLAGVHYWWPKIFGRMYDEFWGRIGAILVFIGFNSTFFVQFILGTRGMPRRYYDYLPRFEPMQAFSTYGSWILGAGMLVVIVNLVASLYKGKPAPGNPWGAVSLEWQITSPPAPHNFKQIPLVTHGPYDFHRAPEILSNAIPGDGAPEELPTETEEETG